MKLFSCSTQLNMIFCLPIKSQLLISTAVFLLNLTEYEIFLAKLAFLYLSAEKISCSTSEPGVLYILSFGLNQMK